ncbi:defensin-like [Ctenocephalides felis]|uniref:defensin-like n=1 Tax=Ctenocephalides felis TaxID=7515 RepID=UPI000E6E247A|nr:defensin-like [Ctenocephalides felis]XP_026464379.1 defensin-like [Ctenocephalides felis]
MKNFIVICFALVALFAAVQSVPLEGLFEDTFQDEPTDLYQGALDNAGVRQKRVTCDLLSVSTKIGSLNHAACAAHCLALRRGFRGGRCENGVCNCRR